jgi:hypothetical protein
VTGCDQSHFELAEDLIASIREVAGQTVAVGFIRLCDTPLPKSISSQVDCVASCAEHFPGFDKKSGYYAAYAAAKPRIPQLFPGFETYSWIDADCWLQNRLTLDKMAIGSRDADLCIHPEIDIHYFPYKIPSDRTLSIYPLVMGSNPSSDLLRTPMVNAGVFSARASSRIWALWEDALVALRHRFDRKESTFLSDQIPLHALMFNQKISVYPLRASDNWQTYASQPQFNPQSGKLVLPTFPFEEISIIHLAGASKDHVYNIGAGQQTKLRYRDIKQLTGRAAQDTAGQEEPGAR